jgi:hypothetical protein
VNPLNEYPKVRKAAYIFQWAVNLVLGVLGIVFLNTYDEVPEWFIIAGLVFNFIWSYTGLTAQQNMPSYENVVEGDAPPPPPEDLDDQRGLTTSELCLIVIAAVVVIVFLFWLLGSTCIGKGC